MYLKGKHYITIRVKGYGDIKIELDESVAPITVNNFIKLVNKKFYDGLTFHRIIDGFMIQGGDPIGDGTGGSDETITGRIRFLIKEGLFQWLDLGIIIVQAHNFL